jgi:hypothetical protein
VAKQDERLSLGGKRDHIGGFVGIVYEYELEDANRDVLPWELLETESEFVIALDFIQAELRAKKTFPSKYFPFFHATVETPSSSDGVVHSITMHLFT